MRGKRSRRLVIDASVASASGGEEAAHPTARHCRRFLEAVLSVCQHMVMTGEIRDEWKTHQSSFARQWRVSMEARKKVDHLINVAKADLRAKFEPAAGSDKERQSLLKDLHLIEAALATDQAVISLDEEARGLFARAARSVGRLRNIAWVNPDKPDEKPIEWLERGAKAEKNPSWLRRQQSLEANRQATQPEHGPPEADRRHGPPDRLARL